jgi:hypothetical protein
LILRRLAKTFQEVLALKKAVLNLLLARLEIIQLLLFFHDLDLEILPLLHFRCFAGHLALLLDMLIE